MSELEDYQQVRLLDLLWPALILLPTLLFVLSIFLLFWSGASQVLEALTIGNGLNIGLPYMLFVPMLMIAVANTLFLMRIGSNPRAIWVVTVSLMPWLTFSFFWAQLGYANIATTLIHVIVFAGGLWLAVRASAKHQNALRLHFGVLVVLFGLCMICVAIMPIRFPQTVGAITVIIVAAGLISSGITVFFFNKRLSWGVLAVALVSLAIDSPKHEMRTVDIGERDQLLLEHAFIEWLTSRPDLDEYKEANLPYPVIIASAEGGGITAGAHAYQTLMGLQANCPMFAQHLFATVGVSGGSFGNALYGSRARSFEGQQSVIPCGPSEDEITTSGLQEDHFAPVAAAFLFSDVPNALIPGSPFGPTRAIALEISFEGFETEQRAYMQAPIEDSWDPTSNSPAMVFVTTDVSTGNRFQFSPIYGGAGWFLSSDKSVSVSSAVGASARFPWITPSAALVGTSSTTNLVDGGYFENTGADTAMDIVRALWGSGSSNGECGALPDDCQVWKLEGGDGCRVDPQRAYNRDVEWGCNIPIHVTYLAIADTATRHPNFVQNAEPQSFLFDPIRTMLKTRSARGTLALTSAEIAYCEHAFCIDGAGVDTGFHVVSIPSENLGLPLGWSLSEPSLRSVSEFSRSMEQCAALIRKVDPDRGEATDFVRMERTDPDVAANFNGCHLATVASLFNLDQYNHRYYGIEGYGYEFQ